MGVVGDVVWKSFTKPITVVPVPLGLISFFPIGSFHPSALAAVSYYNSAGIPLSFFQHLSF